VEGGGRSGWSHLAKPIRCTLVRRAKGISYLEGRLGSGEFVLKARRSTAVGSSVANTNALALVFFYKLDPALYSQVLGAGAVEVLATNTSVEELTDAGA